VPVYQPPTTALPPVETAPPATTETVSAPEPSYTLVGVLSFGDRSSAMFEFAGTVQSVSLGKPVGNTGWILSKVQQRDVILKRNNETKSLVIGQKF
jgi:Tfp pilus assembly protein PilP